MQPKEINTELKAPTHNQLYAKGWTVTQAAREIGVTSTHVSAVINGRRISKRVTQQLWALPHRELNKMSCRKSSNA